MHTKLSTVIVTTAAALLFATGVTAAEPALWLHEHRKNEVKLLNHKADTLVRLVLLDPDTGTRRHETVKPITADSERRLLYTRWVRSRRAEVERLSAGRPVRKRPAP